jgi:hypothetical protein
LRGADADVLGEPVVRAGGDALRGSTRGYINWFPGGSEDLDVYQLLLDSNLRVLLDICSYVVL